MRTHLGRNGNSFSVMSLLMNPFRGTLLAGAKGVQLAEKGMESWQTRKWMELPELSSL